MGMREIVLQCVAVVAISGCVYVTPSVAAHTDAKNAIVWLPAMARLAELNGRHYYLQQDGFACTAGIFPGNAVPSWLGHISISDGQLLDNGSLCNDTVILIGPIDATIEVSPDMAKLHYKNKEYRYFAEPPLVSGALGE